jgi:hypothetical protein
MQLLISQEEQEYLTGLLERAHEEMREEIFRTDDFKYKQDLRGKEILIVSILEKLSKKEFAQKA